MYRRHFASVLILTVSVWLAFGSEDTRSNLDKCTDLETSLRETNERILNLNQKLKNLPKDAPHRRAQIRDLQDDLKGSQSRYDNVISDMEEIRCDIPRLPTHVDDL